MASHVVFHPPTAAGPRPSPVEALRRLWRGTAPLRRRFVGERTVTALMAVLAGGLALAAHALGASPRGCVLVGTAVYVAIVLVADAVALDDRL